MATTYSTPMYSVTIDRTDDDVTEPYVLPYTYAGLDSAMQAAARALPYGVTIRDPRTPGHGRVIYTIVDTTGDARGQYATGTVTLTNLAPTTIADATL